MSGIVCPKYAEENILIDYGIIEEEEFLAFTEIARHECEGYYILGGDALYSDVQYTKPLDREIIDVTLFDESDLFTETKRSQQDKPYYIPYRKHLLEYADPFYCEDTPEKRKLWAFLKERCNLSDEREAVVEMACNMAVLMAASRWKTLYSNQHKCRT